MQDMCKNYCQRPEVQFSVLLATLAGEDWLYRQLDIYNAWWAGVLSNPRLLPHKT